MTRVSDDDLPRFVSGPAMRMSARGIEELIKPSEGYLKQQPDGSCKAYKCPAGVWTCGWGCTDGVDEHTHWTRDEATEALAREMGNHEDYVHDLVTVPLDQRQFDALVSLCYNVGPTALRKSDLMRHLNTGDYARAASHFADFKKARVRGADAKRMDVKDGTLVTLPGLVTRRAREAALFLEGAPAMTMPQRVEPPPMKMKGADIVAKVAAPVAAGGGTVGAVLREGVPSVPPAITQSIENVGHWKTAGRHITGLIGELAGLPVRVVLIAGLAGGGAIAYRIWSRRNETTD